MAVVDVQNINGEKVSTIDLVDAIFNVPVKSSVLHDVVKMQLAKRRSGTASVKNRSDVCGSGRKPFKQKGTGRARQGDVKSPLLKGGGIVFGPKPRSFSYNISKKVRKLALKMALSSKLLENSVIVLDQFELDQIKTKSFVKVLDSFNITKTLIISDKENINLKLSSRNIPNVKILLANGINVYDILKYDNLVLLEPSIKEIERRLLA